MWKAEEVKKDPPPISNLTLALVPQSCSSPLTALHFVHTSVLLWDFKKLHVQSKHGFKCLIGLGVGGSIRSNLAKNFKRPANPGDPASRAQTKLFVLS